MAPLVCSALMLSGAVRPQQGGVWRKETVLQPVAGKGLTEQLIPKHRADEPS